MRTAGCASSVCKGNPAFPLSLFVEGTSAKFFFVFLSYFWETKQHFSPPCVRGGGGGGARECCRNVDMWGGFGDEAPCRWC